MNRKAVPEIVTASDRRGLKFALGLIVFALTPAMTIPTAKAALAGLGGPIVGGAASVGFFAGCKFAGGGTWKCAKATFLADPTASTGITSISMQVAYNASEFTFNPGESGFLCQFSQNGDCPPPGGPAGTFPLALLPDLGFNPGQPLPGADVSLDEAGGTVFLDYTLPSPVTAETDTNFFLFSFDFNDPPTIDLSQSTVTYLASNSGLDFTQLSFVCGTTADLVCGSNNPIKGITLNLATVPEPSTWVLLTTAFIGLLGYSWKWWVMTEVDPDRETAGAVF